MRALPPISPAARRGRPSSGRGRRSSRPSRNIGRPPPPERCHKQETTMTYVEGFVLAVPADKKEAYRRHAAEAVPLFKEFGVTRQVEARSEEHTSELQSLMRISYAVFSLKKKKEDTRQ